MTLPHRTSVTESVIRTSTIPLSRAPTPRSADAPAVSARRRVLAVAAVVAGIAVAVGAPLVRAAAATDPHPPILPVDPIGPSAPAAPEAAPPVYRPALPMLPIGARVMFVLDGSTTLDDALNLEMRKAARRTVQLMAAPSHEEHFESGVVSFDAQARVLCRPPVEKSRLMGCIGSVRQRPGKDIGAGLDTAMDELQRLRGHPGPPSTGSTEIIVLFTDGPKNNRCADPLAKANGIRTAGIRLVVVAVGPWADTDCLGELAPSAHDYFEIARSGVRAP